MLERAIDMANIPQEKVINGLFDLRRVVEYLGQAKPTSSNITSAIASINTAITSLVAQQTAES